MNHAENFERYAIQSNIGFDPIPLESGGKGFRFYQQLDNGPRLLLGIVFNPTNTIAEFNNL